MTTLIVDNENRISVAAPQGENAAASTESGESFGTPAELATLAAAWPAGRQVAIWNKLPGATPVKKFADRKTAISRIWKALEKTWPELGLQEACAAPEGSRRGKPRRSPRAPRTARKNSKSGQVIRLLKRASGATLDQMVQVTSWQPHTVRGFISGALRKRMGMAVESSRREDGARVYRIQS
jgi:hypothetical protein